MIVIYSSAKSTKAILMMCLAQGHNSSISPRIEPSIFVFSKHLLALAINAPNKPLNLSVQRDSSKQLPRSFRIINADGSSAPDVSRVNVLKKYL